MLSAQDIALAQADRIITIKNAISAPLDILLLWYLCFGFKCLQFRHLFSTNPGHTSRLVIKESTTRVANAC